MDCYFDDTNQYYTYAFMSALLVSLVGNVVGCAKYCCRGGRDTSVMPETVEEPFIGSDVEMARITVRTAADTITTTTSDQGVNTSPQAKEEETQVVSPTTARRRRYSSVWDNGNRSGVPSWAVKEYMSTPRD